MKVNHKQMYLMLKQQVKALQSQIAPAGNVEQVNEIPADFNQVGWNLTIEKVEALLAKMKQVREVKGRRLTPPFYRTIYNRALIGINEIDNIIETLTAESTDINYEAECIRLNAEIFALNVQIAELAEKAAAEEAEQAAQEAAAAAKSK